MYKVLTKLEQLSNRMKQQGKTDEQIKSLVSLYLMEFKKKINPNGELDVI